MRETKREQGNGEMRKTERGIDREGEGTGNRGMELKFNLILVKSGEGSFEGLWVFSWLIAGLCRLSR